MMKTYVVSKDMRKYVEYILLRDNIPYTFSENPYGQWNVSVDLSAKKFHLAVKDAICEKEQEETQSNVPIYSAETLRDRRKFLRLQKLFWRELDDRQAAERPFHLLEEEVYRKEK